jgi:hypothetical protein
MRFWTGIFALLLAPQLYRTHDQPCDCDPKRPETMQARECSLCREAEKEPPDVLYFFLKDINPRKPNRWLILPRAHSDGMHHLRMDAVQGMAFWQGAIEKASSLWGSQWGLAANGERSRTQCHAHVHIGKLVDQAAAEEGQYLYQLGASPAAGAAATTFAGPAELKIPGHGEGFWIHPTSGGLHLHVEDPSAACEFVLMR